jgi:methionyl-tRNA formyltransferase
MTVLPIALLLANTFRSRAYAQMLAASGLAPSVVLAIPGVEPAWRGAPVVRVDGLRGVAGDPVEFRPGEPAAATLAGVPWIALPDDDINAAATRQRLLSDTSDVIVYSGMPGVILRRELLSSGRRFLHVHGGVAPAYRGSTAFYYSLLREGAMGVTALWLAEGLDAGPIIRRRAFAPPAGHEIDRVVDPLARAVMLADLLAEFRETGTFPPPVAAEGEAETYHVIHPVLKHLALRRCGSLTAAPDAAASI